MNRLPQLNKRSPFDVAAAPELRAAMAVSMRKCGHQKKNERGDFLGEFEKVDSTLTRHTNVGNDNVSIWDSSLRPRLPRYAPLDTVAPCGR
jgi:hypothetical protein